MDLPITPKFFKKLELFQELKRLDKRNKNHEEWDMEKEFLLWAHESHFHLGSCLEAQQIIEILNKSQKFTAPQLSQHVSKMMQNLSEHGWAERQEGRIKINQSGMFMAEVIYDSESVYKQVLFYFFSYLVWVIIILSFLILLFSFLKLLNELFLITKLLNIPGKI